MKKSEKFIEERERGRGRKERERERMPKMNLKNYKSRNFECKD